MLEQYAILETWRRKSYSISFIYDFLRDLLHIQRYIKIPISSKNYKFLKLEVHVHGIYVRCRYNASSVTVDISACKNMKWSGFQMTRELCFLSLYKI